MKLTCHALDALAVRTLLGVALVIASANASAQTPFPAPTTALQLACNLARSRNPAEFRGWWDRVSGSASYRAWFWSDIAPARVAGTTCDTEVQTMFWQEAVPANWSSVGALPGWDWSSGGYFTQTLWLQAIPENWVSIPGFSGWPWTSGGYYTQTFWLRAVPDAWGPRTFTLGLLTGQSYYRYFFWTGAVAKNWGPRTFTLGERSGQGYYRYWLWQEAVPNNWAAKPAEPGWPWTSGGYYTQALWLRAVPENWAPVADIGGWPWASGGYFTQTFWLKAVPENWAAHDGIALGRGYYGTGGQGYYRFYFWEHAVPDNWVSQADRVGGWPWTSGGYYTQFFWWRAVPEDWLPMADHAIGGVANQGHYAFWLYHFAAPRGFAWRSGLSFRGSRGASYYFVTMHETLPPVHAEYAYLRRLTSNHLAGAAVEEPVSTWFDPAARAVVVLTFDTEGDEAQSCRLAGMLDEEEISATFLLTGTTSAPATTLAHISRAPSWQACLAGFDLGNHTAHHFGNTGFVVNLGTGQLLFNMTDASRQQSEVLDSQSLIESIFLHTPESFRAPWCDGHRSFDGGVTSTLSSVASRAPRFSSGERMLVDSSIATISSAASARGIVPPAHLADLSIDRRPFPYEIAGGANPILEVPFSYPSDWTSASLHGLSLGPPPDDTNPAFLANVWKRNLDEILASNGVMVVLAHPSIMGADADRVAALRSFIRYAKSLPGVRFSTLAEVGERFRDR